MPVLSEFPALNSSVALGRKLTVPKTVKWTTQYLKPPGDPVGRTRFVFKYRTAGMSIFFAVDTIAINSSADVLEKQGIAKKPPPLTERPWKDLSGLERPRIFKQLQVRSSTDVFKSATFRDLARAAPKADSRP